MTRKGLSSFEATCRKAHLFDDSEGHTAREGHPFDSRNIGTSFPPIVRRLFDNGHYSQAVFEAYKFLDKEVQKRAGLEDYGHKLMLKAFAPDNPKIKLNTLSSQSEKDEQNGFQFLFAGGTLAFRNPNAHEVELVQDIDLCLDQLNFTSMLLRRLPKGTHMRSKEKTRS